MTTQHTPGPWRYWTQRRPNVEDTCTFRNLEGSEVLRAVTVTLTEADARLIAAAPELLKQLKIARDEAVGWFDDSRGFDPKNPPDWLSGIDAAIAKATNA